MHANPDRGNRTGKKIILNASRSSKQNFLFPCVLTPNSHSSQKAHHIIEFINISEPQIVKLVLRPFYKNVRCCIYAFKLHLKIVK